MRSQNAEVEPKPAKQQVSAITANSKKFSLYWSVEVPEALRDRTRRFALRIVRLFRCLPRTEEARIIGRQVLRSGTSIGANYRAAARARSRAEFVAKLGIVLEEADETAFWLELMREAEIFPDQRLDDLAREANELVSIFVTSIRTAKESRSLA